MTHNKSDCCCNNRKIYDCHHPQPDPDEPIDDNPPDIPSYLKVYCSPLSLSTRSGSNIRSKSKVLVIDNSVPINYEFHQDNRNHDKRTFFPVGHAPLLYLNGVVFQFHEFHFHDRAENVINNERQSSEIHFVFEELLDDPDIPEVNYAVLGFILKEGDVSDPLVTNILKDRPVNIPELTKYFTFSGSLTKPKFVDVPQVAVAWNVSTEYLNITRNDLRLLRAVYARNSAEVQPSNARNICLIDLSE